MRALAFAGGVLAVAAFGCGAEVIDPHPGPVDRGSELVEAEIRAGNYPAAVEILTRAMRTEERPQSYALERARVHVLWGKYEAALEQYLKVVQDDPDVHYSPRRLLDGLKALAAGWERDVDAYTTREQCDRLESTITKAAESCNRVMKAHHQWRRYYRFDLVLMLVEKPLRRARHRLDLAEVEAALRADPDQAGLLVNRALHRLGADPLRYAAGALEDLDRAARLKGDDAQIWRLKGKAYRAKSLLEEAAAAFHQAAEREPKDAWPQWEQGDALASLGRWQEALTCLDRAIALFTSSAEFYESRARTKLELLRHRKAPGGISVSIAEDCRLWRSHWSGYDRENPCEAFLVLAEAKLLEGDSGGAIDEVRSYQYEHPDPRAESWLLEARCQMANRWLVSARTTLFQAQTAAEEQGSSDLLCQALVERCVVLKLLGEDREAMGELARARKLRPETPEPNWQALEAEHARLKAAGLLPLTAAEEAEKRERDRKRAEAAARAGTEAPAPAKKHATCPVCEGKGQHWSSWSPQEKYLDSVTGRTYSRSLPTKFGWVTCETCNGSGVR